MHSDLILELCRQFYFTNNKAKNASQKGQTKLWNRLIKVFQETEKKTFLC